MSRNRFLSATAIVLPALLSLSPATGCSFDTHGAAFDRDGGTNNGQPGGRAAIPGLTALRVEPAQATLNVTAGGPPQMMQFRAIGTVNGGQRDVTNLVNWRSSRNDVATIHGDGVAITTTGNGGVTTIQALSGSTVGAAQLTVVYQFIGPDPGVTPPSPLPADPAGKFKGAADQARAPQLVYPNDGVLLPPNVFGIEVHFRPGSNNTLFEVAVKSAISDIKVYIRCNQPQGIDGCIYQPSRAVWTGIAVTNAGQGDVSLTVRGTDDTGSKVGSSATFKLAFSKDPVRGALYYWTTSGGTAIMRWNFADDTQTAATKVIDPALTGGTCVGCHTISPDGSKIVASVGGQPGGRVLLYDVTRDQALVPFPLAEASQFETWKPDSTAFIGVGKANAYTGSNQLKLFDGATGQLQSMISVGDLRADHPDWGWKTGTKLAFTSVDVAGSYTDQRPGKSGIAYMETQADGSFGAPKTLVPAAAGKNRYYPAIAPSEGFLVFNESTCPSGDYGSDCDGDTDPSATLYATTFNAGAAPVALAAANAPGIEDQGKTNLTSSYPKWSPFEFYLSETQTVMWLTVSSSRRYGLRPAPPGDRGTFIWMVGVDPSALNFFNQDPSYAAFCLPFQDVETSNHIAQWTRVVPEPAQ